MDGGFGVAGAGRGVVVESFNNPVLGY